MVDIIDLEMWMVKDVNGIVGKIELGKLCMRLILFIFWDICRG